MADRPTATHRSRRRVVAGLAAVSMLLGSSLLGTGAANAASPATTVMHLHASTVNAVNGEDITLYATVASGLTGAPPPTGTLTFAGAIDPAVSVALATNTATHRQEAKTTTAFHPGTYTVTATYNGDANYTPNGPLSITITVTKAASTVTIIATPSTTSSPHWTLTAKVRAASPGRDIATGSAVFTVDNVTGAPIALNTSGNAYVHLALAKSTSHIVKVTYTGDINFAGTRASRLVAVTPVPPSATGTATSGTVFLHTVPALAGVQLSVGATVVATDGSGNATAQVSDLNAVASTVTLADGQLDGQTRLAVGKVVTAPHSAPHESHVTIGLDTTSLVRLQVDAGTTGVAANSVRLVRVRSVTGQVLTIDPMGRPLVQLASRRTRLSHGILIAQPITWSVDRVSAGPDIALTTATQHFEPLQQPVWNIVLQTIQGTVHVSTVPATPGVMFHLDGSTFTTGPDGSAVTRVGDLNNVNTRLQLETPVAGLLSVELTGVTKLDAPSLRQRTLVATLAVSRPVTLRFVDPAGNRVDAGEVREVSLSGAGAVIHLDSQQITKPVMLLADVATRIENVWQPRQFVYTISSVQVEGANAVFAGQQRFDPTIAASWPVRLSMFELTVSVHDVLFGTRVRSRMVVIRPDGTSYSLLVGRGAPTLLPSMVHGLYDLKLQAAAVGGPFAVLVSRNDAVDLRVVTFLDAVVMAAVVLTLTIAAVVGGKRVARRRGRVDATEAR